MPRKQKKYHYIYKTTCQVTGKFYVGMHSTDNLEDGYLGSGKILGYSIGKHSRENHVKEILEFCETRDQLKRCEAEFVNAELLAHPLNINLKYGGEGGWDHLPPDIVRANAIRNSGVAKFSFEKRSDIMKRAWISSEKLLIASRENFAIARKSAIAKSMSSESREKRIRTMEENCHQQGCRNSQFGTKWAWVHKQELVKKIPLQKLEIYLAEGWLRGRCRKILL